MQPSEHKSESNSILSDSEVAIEGVGEPDQRPSLSAKTGSGTPCAKYPLKGKPKCTGSGITLGTSRKRIAFVTDTMHSLKFLFICHSRLHH